MQWIIYSAIMYITSVISYLLIRKNQKGGIAREINTFMFLTPALPFVFIFAFLNNIPLLLSPINTLIMVAAIFFFSYLGNVFSFIGMKEAPNAGYSLIIQKSYAIYTAVVALFLFKSALSIQGFLSIAVIVLFSGTIILDKNKKQPARGNKWLIGSLLAFFMFGNLALFSKYMQNQGVSPWTILFYITFLNGIFNGLDILKKRKKIKLRLKSSTWVILIIIGLSNGLFNLMMQFAYKTAPNIGYVNIINAASITLITLLSTYFFKDKLSIEKIIGVVGVTLGLVLLVLV